MGAAQREDGIGSANGPEHSRPFQAGANHGFAAGFDHARSHKQVLAAKLRIAYALRVLLKVVRLGADLLGDFGKADRD